MKAFEKQLVDAIQGYVRQEKRSAPGLLNVLKDLHRHYFELISKNNQGASWQGKGNSKKARKKASGLAALAAGSQFKSAVINIDKAKVGNMPDLVQRVIPVALTFDEEHDEGDVGEALEKREIILLKATLDAITAIRDVPSAEVGVKGFIVGVKQALKDSPNHDDHGHLANSEELEKAYNDLIRAIGVSIVPEVEPVGTKEDKLKEGLQDANAADLLLAMTIREQDVDSASSSSSSSSSTPTTPITISEAKERSRIALEGTQMIKIASYATSLLPGLRAVKVDEALVQDALLALIANAHYVKTRVSSIEEKEREKYSESIADFGRADLTVPQPAATNFIITAARLFSMHPRHFAVERHARPLFFSMAELGMYERLTECFQLYKRVVLADDDEVLAASTTTTAAGSGKEKGEKVIDTVEAVPERSPFSFLWSKMPPSVPAPATAKQAEEGATRIALMTALAREVATAISRGDDDYPLNLKGLGDDEEEEGNEDSSTKSSASLGTAVKGVDRSQNNNHLMACRQAAIIAGIFSLVDLRRSLQERLKWIKIMGFSYKGKWQFAYQLCASSDKSDQAYRLYCHLKSRGLYFEANMILQEEMTAMAQGGHKGALAGDTGKGRDSTGSRGTEPLHKGHHVHLWEPVTADELQRQAATVRSKYLPLPLFVQSSGSNGGNVNAGLFCQEMGGILMVDDLPSLELAARALFGDESDDATTTSSTAATGPLRFVSMDAEWRATIPQGGGFHQTKGASILQVAVPALQPSASIKRERGPCVLIFDLDTLSLGHTEDSGNYSDRDEDRLLILARARQVLGQLFDSPHVVKIGWELGSGDISMLRAAGKGAFKQCFKKNNGLMDLAKLVQSNYVCSSHHIKPQTSTVSGGGASNAHAAESSFPAHVLRPIVIRKTGNRQLSLSDATEAFLGRPLHKTLQISDWSQRPLSVEQQCYASNDALVLLGIMDTVLHDYHSLLNSSADGTGRVPESLGVRKMYLTEMLEQQAPSTDGRGAPSTATPGTGTPGTGTPGTGTFMELPVLIHGHNTAKTNALHKELSSLLS